MVDEEGGQILSHNPVKHECQYCAMEVVTYVEHEINPIFYVSCILFLFLFGKYGFILMPIAYFLFKTAVHRCSRCLAHLSTNTFGMPDFSQEVIPLPL